MNATSIVYLAVAWYRVLGTITDNVRDRASTTENIDTMRKVNEDRVHEHHTIVCR